MRGPKNQNRSGNDVIPETEEEREHREVQTQIDNAVTESVDSSRRMLEMVRKSKEAGLKTLVCLDEQGEQLDRIEEGVNRINSDMKKAEKSLKGLEKFCGLCVLPWKRQKSTKGTDYDTSWNSPNDGQANTSGTRPTVGGGTIPTGNMVARITEDEREDELEENLQQVSSALAVLKNMATDMNSEIDTQNQTATRISYQAGKLGDQIGDADKRTRDILKKS